MANSGDWITVGTGNPAQNFLASAVSAAADALAPPPPQPTPTSSSGPEWPAPPPPPTPAPLPGLAPGGILFPPHPIVPAGNAGNALQLMMAAMIGGDNDGAAGDGVVAPGDAAAVAAAGVGAGMMGAAAGGVAAVAAAGVAGGQAPPLFPQVGDGVSAYFGMPGGGKSVLIHYEGHKSRYDEWITTQSPRLAPFRSRTTRPLSVTMQSVEKVVHGASIRCLIALRLC